MLIAPIHLKPQLPAIPAGRSIHLVDLENLLGGTDVTAADVAAVREAYMDVAAVQPGDVVVIATSHHVARTAWFSWGGARRLVRSGPDGADLALLDVIVSEQLADRFDRVVVASGDGIFAEPCARLQTAGCQVTVISRPEALSRRLAFAVRDVLDFSAPPALAPVIALHARVA